MEWSIEWFIMEWSIEWFIMEWSIEWFITAKVVLQKRNNIISK